MPIAPAPTATFKPRDVEELIDFYFHRRLANAVVRVLAPLPVSPNQVTVASAVVALLALAIIGWAGDSDARVLAGAAVFLLSVVLDCADGQLARLRNVSSLTGRALDGFVDVVSIAAIFVGQFLWMHQAGFPLWLTFSLGWGAGFSLRWHAHTYDHVKNLYLHNSEPPKAEGGSWLPSEEEIERERQEHVRAGRTWGDLVMRGFAMFTRAQRAGSDAQLGADGRRLATPAQREAYVRHFRAYMRIWTFNGVGTHLFMLTLATAAIPWIPSAPLWAWGVICGPMNLMTIALERWRKDAEPRVRDELARLAATGGQRLTPS
jgi:hypothetical protein